MYLKVELLDDRFCTWCPASRNRKLGEFVCMMGYYDPPVQIRPVRSDKCIEETES